MCALVDAYYLQLERKYRKLYSNSVDQLEVKSTLKEVYNMDVRSISCSYWECLFSKSMVMPYLIILLLIVGVVLVHYGIGLPRLCVQLSSGAFLLRGLGPIV